MEKQSPLKLYSAIILAMMFFSMSFVWFKIANVSYGPLTIVLFRLVISASILFLYTRFTKKLILPARKDFKYLLLLAFFEPFLYFMGESYGLQYISSTVASVIIATIPLVAPIAAYLFYREKVSIRNLLGIVISFFGVIVVIYEMGVGITASPLGIILQFSAVFSAVGYTIVLHKISSKINNISIILFQNFIGAIYFLPFWLIFESTRFATTPFDREAMIAIVELSLFASTIAFIFFTFSVRHMGVVKSNMFVNVIPVCTAIFAWIILNDQLTLQKFVGIIIVITGLFIAQLKFKKQYNGPDPIPFE
jgi:drug/metabolite transporter (DMT)-like permease